MRWFLGNFLLEKTVTGLPDSEPKAPAKLAEPLQDLVGFVKYGALTILVIALIGAGIELVRSRSQGTAYDGGSQIIKVLIAVIIVSSATTMVSFLLF